jgi:hypothetical protein
MPNVETHIEIAKPIVGGSTSLFAGLLLEYIGVTTPIFVAASFGAIMAVIMLKEFSPVYIKGLQVPSVIVALFVSLCGGISACFGYKLINPLLGLNLEQAPATALLAFILVYFTPIILKVIQSRIERFN